jgi:hypothetical protein
MTGLGAPILSFFDVTALTATGTITLNLANAGINAVPITKGRLRIKTTAVNAATTTAIGAVSVTDGTNTVQASAALLAVTAVGTAIDIHIDIYSELQVNSISFTVTLAGSATVATVSTEFFANP